jgi:hypothetical protein
MNCNQVRDLLVDYLGGEIGRQDGRNFKHHLLSCPACRKELAALRSTQNTLVQGWPEELIPQPLSFKLEAPTPSTRKPFWGLGTLPPFLRWPLTVTASFILCISTLALTRSSFQYSQGQFSVSFGQPAGFRSGALAGPLSQEQIKMAVAQEIGEHPKGQEAQLKVLLAQFEERWASQQQSGYQQVANRLKYLEATQNLVWKETAQNKSYVESLARDFYLRSGVARAERPVETAGK